MDRIADGSSVVITIRKSRNLDHLKKYWVICAAAAAADHEWDDREDADHWVRVSIPWMREQYRLGPTRIGIRLKSISVDEMDQAEFDKFYERAVELLSMRVGTDVEQLSKEARNA
jgi:hypothetical protein